MSNAVCVYNACDVMCLWMANAMHQNATCAIGLDGEATPYSYTYIQYTFNTFNTGQKNECMCERVRHTYTIARTVFCLFIVTPHCAFTMHANAFAIKTYRTHCILMHGIRHPETHHMHCKRKRRCSYMLNPLTHAHSCSLMLKHAH